MEKEYNKELRLTVVKENEAGVSQQSLAKKYGVARSTIKNWCYQYQMYGEAGIENSLSKTKYSGEFKLSVLNYRHIHQVSYREGLNTLISNKAPRLPTGRECMIVKGLKA